MCDFKRSPPCFWCCCGFRADTQSEQWKEFGCPASSLAQQNCHHHQKQDLQAAFELLQIGDGSCQADRRTYKKTIKLIKPRHTNIARYRGSMKTTPLNLLQRCIAHLLSPFFVQKSFKEPQATDKPPNTAARPKTLILPRPTARGARWNPTGHHERGVSDVHGPNFTKSHLSTVTVNHSRRTRISVVFWHEKTLHFLTFYFWSKNNDFATVNRPPGGSLLERKITAFSHVLLLIEK